MGRRPAGRPPPAVPQAGARRRARPRPRAARSATLAGRRLRAADRAHQRRPGGGRGVRGAGARRSGSPTCAADPGAAGRAGSTSSTVYVPVGDADAGARGPGRGRARAGSATTTTRRSRRPGEGRFRPLEGAHPTIGAVGQLEVVDEVRIEVRAAAARRGRGRRGDAGRAPLRGAGVRRRRARRPGHVARPAPAGSATVEPRRRSAASPSRSPSALPATAHGVRVAGDPDRAVRRVAVCGGAGDFLLDAVLGDRRRRLRDQRPAPPPGGEFLEQGGPALVDVAHWAAEWTWLPVVARGDGWREALGDTVETRVSTLRTDPWTSSDTLKEHALKADPSAQLKLLDVQELDARGRPAAPPAGDACPSSPRSRRSSGHPRRARRPAARRADPGRRPHRRAGEGRRRRRAGQGPAHARPGPDGPGADHQPQGPRADAARARVAASGGSPASRTTSSR